MKNLQLFPVFLLAAFLFSGCPQPYNDTPTDDGDILIYSPEDMAKIGVVNNTHPLSGTYILMNDITLANWSPVGDNMRPFTGVFNGNGKIITLTGFAVTAVSGRNYLGIFGFVKGASSTAKAVIKNLTIDPSVAVNDTSSAGQAVGLVAGCAELASIENITLSGTFDFESGNTILLGGIAGLTDQAGTVIKNCNSSLTMNIIPGNGNGLASYSFVGGFAGMFRNGARIENCHNTGNITADNTENTVSGQVFVGGIAGGSSFAMNTNYKGYIKGSSSTGNITGRARGLWTFAGGIAGTIEGGGNGTLENTTRIERCFAAGTVSVAGTISSSPYVGGIVGYNYYGALVSQSYFNGTVIADKSGDYTGGIVGYNSQTSGNNSRVEDCWSGGEVKGFNNAGGIVGQNQVNTYIRRCYSTALVSVSNSASVGIGGIAGMNASVLTDAITACVALNPSLSAPAGNNIHRITGTSNGNRSNNHAWSGMEVTTSGTYTPETGTANADGADLAVQKPVQSFYADIGWDFNNVWEMDNDGYPKLMWQ
jgi:hypothetical protein